MNKSSLKFPEIFQTRKFLFFYLILLFISLSGCQSIKYGQEKTGLLDWKYADLRLLDPADSVRPDQDLIAVYDRLEISSFKLRLDFLDLNEYLGKDIYIPIDTNLGGSRQLVSAGSGNLATDFMWDYLIKITDSGAAELLDQNYTVQARSELFIIYDSFQDRIVIDIINNELPIYPGRTKLQVIVTEPESSIITDKSQAFVVDGPSPARAQVMLAFWNTFSSITPAQTLRSWAGAHSGPMSTRHGLEYLLNAASRTKSPVYLFNFSTPENYSALTYLGVERKLQNLSRSGILNIVGIEESWDKNLKVLYLRDDNNNNFGDIDYANKKEINQSCNLTPGNSSSAYVHGLSTECVKTLITYAVEYSSSPLVLGGDFSVSSFGVPDDSNEIFGYFATHPWIQILSLPQLKAEGYLISDTPLTFDLFQTERLIGSASTQVALAGGNNSSQVTIFDALQQSPNNQITKLAWQVYTSLTQNDSQQIQDLRNKYIGQIGGLVVAAKWAEAPGIQQSCNEDIDYDTVKECILSNEQTFLIIDPEGGYISFAFSANDQGIHQVIGPTWEFYVGLSDPSSWDASLGLRGDSAQILGAFQDPFADWNTYQPSVMSDQVILSTHDDAITKSISISGNRIQINIQNLTQYTPTYQIPLVVDPWIRFTPDWGRSYLESAASDIYQWGIKNGEIVTINASTALSPFAFNDTYLMMKLPENPNYDYSRGHYLPFPMSVVELENAAQLIVDIRIQP
jgi:hypothetical protein